MTATPRSPTSGAGPSTVVPRTPTWAGSWYFVVTVVSLGLLAWIPFVHAASRLRSRSRRMLAVVYAVAAVVILVMISVTPADTADMAAADNAIGVVAGMLIPCVVISALVTQAFVRRQVYSDRQVSQEESALAEAMAARTRRDDPRHLPRTYDDGGLVDINSAPAEVIPRVCGLPLEVADEIVSVRVARGGFLTVDDVFGMVDVPIAHWDLLRDRALVVPPLS